MSNIVVVPLIMLIKTWLLDSGRGTCRLWATNRQNCRRTDRTL